MEYWQHTGAKPYRDLYTSDLSARAEAKRALGLDPEAPHLVIMAGNIVSVHLSDLISVIYVDDEKDSAVTCVCGKNTALRESLTERLGHIGALHFVTVPEDPKLLLESADLLLSEPDPDVAAAAAKKRLPLVLYRSKAGTADDLCERLSAAGSAVICKSSGEAAEACIRLLSSEMRRQRMAQSYRNP